MGNTPEKAISPRLKTLDSDGDPHNRQLEIALISSSDLILESVDLPTLAKPNIKCSDQTAHPLALVTGSRGQDGSYLMDLLGHEQIVGCVNPDSQFRTRPSGNEVSINLWDKTSVTELLRETRPSSIFHLAAKHGPSTTMTFEKDDKVAMQRLHVEGTRNLLEAIESLGLDTHLVVAGSSRIFSPNERITSVSEGTPPNPQDFYGETKLAAWELVKHFRSEFGTRASFLVLFNHESPRRPKGYFSQDVAHAIYKFMSGITPEITLRNADFMGDWCDARDVVRLMDKLADLIAGEDLVVGSGELQSVSAVVENTLGLFGIKSPGVKSAPASEKFNPESFLVSNNGKSIELGMWKPEIPIEKTIFQIVENISRQDDPKF